MHDELERFRCRVRTRGVTLSVDCLAPDEPAAAYAVGAYALRDDPAPWVQIVVAAWSASLQQFVVSPNAVVVTREDPPPPGNDRVVLAPAGTAGQGAARSRTLADD